MSKTVIINHNGQQQQLQLPQGRTQHLRFNPQAHYRFLDEQQQPIEAIKIEQKGNSLWFYLPEQAEPILILDNASQFVPMFHLDNPLYLPPAAASGTAESALLATAVSTPTSGNAWKVGLGALALLGAGAAIAGSSSSNEEAEPAQPSTPPTPPSNIDTTAPVLTLSVQPLANINSHNINQLHSLSGTISGNEILHNVQVKVLINGVEKTAAVSDNIWSLELSGAELAQQQGSQNLQITATAHDAAGNIAHAQTSATYQVDTQIDTPLIHFNSITDDNIINLAESQTAVQISGNVQHFHAGDKLSVAIGQASPILVDIQTDGSFQFMVDGRTLAAHAEIHASLTTQDSAGNHATASAQANYAVDITPPNPEITFNPITSDNKIDLAESQGSINVSGNITGAKDGDEVIVSCGCPTCSGIKWIDIKTTLTDGKFSVNFEGADMVANDGKNIIKATITTSDNAKNTATATAEKSYEIDITSNPIADQQAQIYLDDVKLDLAKEIASVRLSGKLDFANSDSMYKWGHNKDFVQDIKLKIGEKTFDLRISQKDYSFYLDLTQKEYQELKGKNISYELKATGTYFDWLPTFDYKSEGKEKWVDVPANWTDVAKVELAKVKVNFDNSNIQNSKKLQFNIDTKTEISGKVVNANADDEITINIAGKEHKATVKNDLTFSIQVENSELNNLKNIQATLNTKNNKGENISVSDVGYVLQDMQVSDNFVNPHKHIEIKDRVIQHSDPSYNFAYFIHANTPYGKHTGGFLGKLLSVKNGGEPVTLKYYFVTQEDYDSGRYQPTHLDRNTWSPYSEAHKEVVRDIYKQIENTTNIKFVETQIESEKDIYFTRGNNLNKGIAGTASYGHGVDVNIYDANEGLYKAVLIHEIMHTFGTDHIRYTLSKLDYGKNEISDELSNMVNAGKDGLLRIFDLAYLHYRFGVNPNHNSGNDIYRFQTYTDKTSEAGVYIWDGGGIDTFDASQEKEGVNVNLTPGSWIYRGEKVDSFIIKDKIKINDFNEVNKFFPEFPDVKFIGNVNFKHEQTIYQEGQAFIGYGTQIENLIGSAHNDVLTGNKAANNIFGGDGNDKIDGGEGNDYLDGGKGADIMLGGLGDDIFVVDNGNDQIIENTAEGNDTVYAFLDYSLPNNVENIHLFGTANQATGNELNNIITGNDHNNILLGGAGNDTLNGGRGSDTVTGDSGTDTFVFNSLLDGSIDTITDFEIGTDKIQLSSNIFTHLTNNNLAEYLQYNQNTGALFYDPDGKGNMDSIHFATLQNRPDLPIDINHFILG